MARSTFNSSVPGSAWWTANSRGRQVVESTTGYGFVWSLQTVLKRSLSQHPLPTYTGTVMNGSEINADGAWGPNTFKGLWAVVNSVNPTVAASIRSDALAGRIGRVSLAAAVITVGNGLGDTVSTMPSDAVVPPYNRRAPGTGTSITREVYTATPVTPTTRPTTDPSTTTSVSVNASPAPVPAPPTPPPAPTGSTSETTLPPPRTPVPTSATGAAASGTAESQINPNPALGSRISWGVVAVAVLGVGAAVALTMSLGKQQKKSPIGHVALRHRRALVGGF